MKQLEALAKLLRKRALGYPETYEEAPWGDRVVKVRGKIFFFCGVHAKQLYVTVKLPASGRAVLQRKYAEPTHYGMGKHGWVTSKFNVAEDVPTGEVEQWIDESFRAIAPQRLSVLTEVGGGVSVRADGGNGAAKAGVRSKAKAGAAEAGAAEAGAAKAGAAKAGAARAGATKAGAAKAGATKAGATKAGAADVADRKPASVKTDAGHPTSAEAEARRGRKLTAMTEAAGESLASGSTRKSTSAQTDAGRPSTAEADARRGRKSAVITEAAGESQAGGSSLNSVSAKTDGGQLAAVKADARRGRKSAAMTEAAGESLAAGSTRSSLNSASAKADAGRRAAVKADASAKAAGGKAAKTRAVKAVLFCLDPMRAKRAVAALAARAIGCAVATDAAKLALGRARVLIVDVGRQPNDGLALAARVDASDAAVHLFVAGVRDAAQARQLRALGSAESFRVPPGDDTVADAVARALAAG